MKHGTTITTTLGFDDAVERTRQALAEQGFGVLTEIDVQAPLKTKLDQDMEPYLIPRLPQLPAPGARRRLRAPAG